MITRFRSILRRLRSIRRADVRYDLLDDLTDALEDLAERAMLQAMRRTHAPLADSQCVACGLYGTWSIRRSVCPTCANLGCDRERELASTTA